MAKKKTESTSTLVPVEEQPYQVPENWCWVRLKAVVSDSKERTTEFDDPSTKYVGLEHLEKDSGIIGYGVASDVKSQKSVFHNQQVLYGRLRPYLNKHDVAHFDGVCSTDILVFDSSNFVQPKLLNYYLSTPYFVEYAVSNSKGINLPRVSADVVGNAAFPLPPESEQQRIVDRIESLFEKLDEAKEKVQEAMDSFETRKNMILHEAFSGKLTNSWRAENRCSNEWRMVPLSDICELRSGTTIPTTEELKAGAIPYIKVADMNLPENQTFITTSSRFVNHCAESHEIPYGSTIFPKRGGAIFTNKKRFVAVDKIIMDLNTMAIMPDNNVVDSKYIFYWMQSIDLKSLNNGSSVPQINNKDMVKLFVPISEKEEQKEVVRILDDFFAKEAEAKEKVEATLEAIEDMKKAILAKAFRGELGTNEPEEEGMEGMLKELEA